MSVKQTIRDEIHKFEGKSVSSDIADRLTDEICKVLKIYNYTVTSEIDVDKDLQKATISNVKIERKENETEK